MHKFLFFFLCLILGIGYKFPLLAQPATVTSEAEVLAGFLASTDSPLDEEELNTIEKLLENPVQLNKATASDLEEVPWIDQVLANQILTLRDSLGLFTHITELLNIPGLSQSAFNLIAPLITTVSPNTSKQKSSDFKYQIVKSLIRRLDLPAGFHQQKGFDGSPVAMHARIYVDYANVWRARLTLEKDPGEAFKWRPGQKTYGFDHLSGVVQYRGNGKIEGIILGDYRIKAGQGLLFGKRTERGKGVLPTRDPVKTKGGIYPSHSREENDFFRGIAVSLKPLSDQ